MFGFVDDAHPAAADLSHDAEIAEDATGGSTRTRAVRFRTIVLGGDQLERREHSPQSIGMLGEPREVLIARRRVSGLEALADFVDDSGEFSALVVGHRVVPRSLQHGEPEFPDSGSRCPS